MLNFPKTCATCGRAWSINHTCRTKFQRLALLRQEKGKYLHSDAMGYMLAAQNFPDTARGRQQAWEYRCYAMEAQRMAAASYADARRVLGNL